MSLLRRSTAALPELEMVPLAERLRAMVLFRSVLAGLLIIASAVPPGIGGQLDRLATVTGGYLILSIAGYLLWRIWPGRGLALFSALLLLDGVFLSWATYLAGGVGGPVSYLVIAYVVAVTLLASYRAGLKVLLWLSILLVAGFHLRGTGVLPALGIHTTAHTGSDYERMVLFVAGLWLIGIVTATHSALNERELRRRRYDLTALTNMASELERDMRPDAIAAVFLHSTVDTFAFVRGVVLARSEDGLLSTAACQGASSIRGTVPVTATLEHAWNTRRPLLVKRLSENENGPLTELMPDARNVVVVPLIAEGSAVGVLVVEHSKARIEQRALTMLTQFTSHASLALRNAWLLEEMRAMADHDPLTGIANRRSFDTRLELELRRARRTRDPVSLLLLDLDHFKQVNDEFGHQAGDEILRALGSVLTLHAREVDMAARYGGEEFALILSNCSAEDAVLLGERLRSAVAELNPVPAVTASIGVASWPQNALHASALVSAADDALYQAKRTGRNKLVLSTLAVGEPAAVSHNDRALEVAVGPATSE